MQNTRQYELVYIVSPTATEQELADLHGQVEATVARFGATLARTDNWGRRKLAYQIGGHKEGTYVLDVIDGGGEVVKELDRRLKVNEHVLRHLFVRVDEELRAAERLKNRRHAEAERRGQRKPAAAPASAETPAAGPAETPAAGPAETPAAGPAETPAAGPAETPAAGPAETPAAAAAPATGEDANDEAEA
jgi:small subunit ribosomal protein S6